MEKLKGKTCIIASYLLLVFIGCQSTQIINNKFLNLHNSYKITLPDESWDKIKISNEDLAMRNKENNATFAIISHPVDTNKATLETLYKQLFFGIKRKTILEKEYVNIDGQRVLHIVLIGELDTHKIKISAYIIKAKNLVHDIVYWSPPDKFDISLRDFEGVFKSFKFIPGQT